MKSSNVEEQTQISEVLKYLKRYRNITSMEAFEKFGATRLSDIVYKLRKRGYDIKTVMCEGKTRYGGRTSFAIYRYVKYNGVDNTIEVKRMRGEL